VANPNLKGLQQHTRDALLAGLAEASRAGLKPRINSAFRSHDEQQQLYNAYLARGKTGLPAAPPGASDHESGEAVDLSELGGRQKELADILQRHGFHWGGEADHVHFRYSAPPSALADALTGGSKAPRSNLAAALQGGTTPAAPTDSKLAAALTRRQKVVRPTAARGGDTSDRSALAAAMGATPATAPTTAPPPVPAPAGGGLAAALAATTPTTATATAPAGLAESLGGTVKLSAPVQAQAQPAAVHDMHGFTTSPASDPGAALHSLSRAVTAADNGKNAYLNTVAEEVAAHGFGAAFSAATHKKAELAAREALVDLEHDVPPHYTRTLAGLEKGKSNRLLYNAGATVDYIAGAITDPSQAVFGPAAEIVAPPIKAGAKALLKKTLGPATEAMVRAAEAKAPGAVAAIRGAGQKVATIGEAIGFGPNAKLKREVAQPYQLEMERRIGKLGQVVRELRDYTIKRRKALPEFSQGISQFQADVANHPTLSQAHGPMQGMVSYLLTQDIGDRADQLVLPPTAMRQASAFAKRYQISLPDALHYANRVLVEANDTIGSLERTGAAHAGSLSTAGTARQEFMADFASRLFSGRKAGARLGEVGSHSIAGTEIPNLRRSVFANLTERLSQEGTHVAPVTPGQPLRPGWAQIPDAESFGALRGKQAPAPIVRLLQSEALSSHYPAPGEKDEVTALGHKALSVWAKVVGVTKKGYLSNPGTLLANAGSNGVASEIAARRSGVNPGKIGTNFPKSASEVWTFLRTGKPSADIEEFSRYSNSFVDSMASTAGLAAAKTPADVAGTAGRVVRIGGRAFYLPPGRELAAQAGNALVGLHGGTEQAFKLSLFKALKGKLGPEKAAEVVERHLFDYGDRSALLEAADRYGLWVFNAYPLKAWQLFADTAAHRPDLLLRFPRLKRMLTQEFGAGPAAEQLPEHQQGLMTIPIGPNRFINLGRYFPLTEQMETASSLLHGHAGAPTAQSLIQHSLPGTALSVAFGRNPMTGADLVPPGTPPDEARDIQMRALRQGYLPSLAPGGRGLERIGKALRHEAGPGKYGKPQPIGEALSQTLAGVPVYHAEEKQERLAPQLEKRAAAAEAYLHQARAEAEHLPNPYAANLATSKVNPQMLRRLVKDNGSYLKREVLNAENYDAHGQLNDTGKKRLRRALLYRLAIADYYRQQPHQ
jgi:hypothetical protein